MATLKFTKKESGFYVATNGNLELRVVKVNTREVAKDGVGTIKVSGWDFVILKGGENISGKIAPCYSTKKDAVLALESRM